MYIKGFVNERFQWSSFYFIFYFQVFHPNPNHFLPVTSQKDGTFARATELLTGGIYPALAFVTLPFVTLPVLHCLVSNREGLGTSL